MADNITLNAGTGGDITRAVDNAGVKTQAVILSNSAGSALITGDATNGIDCDVTRVPTDPFGANADAASATGSYSAKLRTIATNLILPAALGAQGALKVEGVASGTAQPISGTVTAVGDVAHDTGDSGNPVKVGGVAIAYGTNPTAVTAGDRTNLYANRAGIPFNIGGHPNIVTYGMSVTTAISNTVIGPTIASGLKFVVTALTVTTDNANTVFPSIVVGFGTATTPAFATTPGTAKVVGGHPGIPAGGGFKEGDGSAIIGVGADDEELRVTTVGNVTNLYIVVKGFTIES